MRSGRQMSTVPPVETAQKVKPEVSGGEYAVEGRLKEQVGPAFDAMKNDPSRGVSLKDVRARLKAEMIPG